MSVVLITGSSGLVGSESVNFFCKKGFDVIGIDNNLRKFFFGAEGSTLWVRNSLLKKNGFKVLSGVAGIETAFTASYGQGRPIIGILGEFDANAGISQKLKPVKEARIPGAAGHGCGHNLFGTASLGAAVAIKEQIEKGNINY